MNVEKKPVTVLLFTLIACGGKDDASCSADDLAELQATCISLGGTSFSANTASDSVKDCGASGSALTQSGSAECRIEGSGECAIVCEVGEGSNGDSGDGETSGDGDLRASEPCGGTDWLQIDPGGFIRGDVGDAGACGVCGDGGLSCFSEGQEWRVPVGNDFQQVAVGSLGAGFACALKRDGSPLCWEDDDGAQSLLSAEDVPNGPFVVLDLDDETACGQTPFGDLECWDRRGQNVNVSPPSGKMMSFRLGTYGDCFITEGNVTTCRDGAQNWSPTGQYASLDTATSSRGQIETACGIAADGAVSCFDSASSNSAYSDWSPSGTFYAVAMGGQGGCGVEDSGEISCWGDVTGAPSGVYVSIAGAGSSFCAIRDDGALSCWGSLREP